MIAKRSFLNSVSDTGVRMLSRLLAILGVLALAACATPYQSSVAGWFFVAGGYDQKDMGNNVWQIGFHGNVDTTRETLQTYWLYRSAEIALDHGFDGFEVVSDMKLTDGILTPRPVRLAATYVPMFIYVPQSGSNIPYNFGGNIRLLKMPFDSEPPKIFDAAVLKARLEPMVKGKKCEKENVCPHEHDYLVPAKP